MLISTVDRKPQGGGALEGSYVSEIFLTRPKFRLASSGEADRRKKDEIQSIILPFCGPG
jgi:hypothetical protein